MSERKRSTKKRVPKEGTPKPKIHIAKKGIRSATLKRLIKAGSGVKDGRVSLSGVEATKGFVERYIIDLGEICEQFLALTEKKTVTKDLLSHAIKHNTAFGCKRRLINAVGSAASGRKGEKGRGCGARTIVKLFSKGLPLKTVGGVYNISGQAKRALASLADELIMAIAHKAGKMALSAGKLTITGKLVKYAVTDCD